MACIDLAVGELEDEGWMASQARRWLASHYVVREGGDWRLGETFFFTHLLDGSRAANRLGWQSTTGIGAAQVYGFSRWQVEKRAAGLCASCELVHACPIENWPGRATFRPRRYPGRAFGDPNPAQTRSALDGTSQHARIRVAHRRIAR
ncbi:MAG: FAD-binding domain-containing protein [Acidimicrobiales bacterium]